MAIFGIMTAIAYTTLGETLDKAAMLGERMDRLQAVQRADALPGQRLGAAAAPRPVRDELGDRLRARRKHVSLRTTTSRSRSPRRLAQSGRPAAQDLAA